MVGVTGVITILQHACGTLVIVAKGHVKMQHGANIIHAVIMAMLVRIRVNQIRLQFRVPAMWRLPNNWGMAGAIVTVFTIPKHAYMILVIAVKKLAKALLGAIAMSAVPTAIIVGIQQSSQLYQNSAVFPYHLSLATAGVMAIHTIRRRVDGTWEIVVSKHARSMLGILTITAAKVVTTVWIQM